MFQCLPALYRCFVLCTSDVCYFCFKQKKAYELRISDWSSDLCSSDLNNAHPPHTRLLSIPAWMPYRETDAPVAGRHASRPRAAPRGRKEKVQRRGSYRYLFTTRGRNGARIQAQIGQHLIGILPGDRKSTRLNSSH